LLFPLENLIDQSLRRVRDESAQEFRIAGFRKRVQPTDRLATSRDDDSLTGRCPSQKFVKHLPRSRHADSHR
jgi:hypothetical protein